MKRTTNLTKGMYAVVFICLLLISACASQPKPDYTNFLKHKPQSILVLPPLNQSVEVNASYIYLSTITRPLAECGYYVYPVAVIDAFLKENGLPTPNEMHTVALPKIREIIGADAVLYVTIEDWGQKYKVISSNTVVKAKAELIHVMTGEILWIGTSQAVKGSGDGGGGIIGMLISALVTQVVNSMVDQTYSLSRVANDQMVFNEDRGLIWGQYNTILRKETIACIH